MGTVLERDAQGRPKAAYPEGHNPLQSDPEPLDVHAGDQETFSDDGEPPEEFEVNPNPLVLEGTGQLSFDVGGEKPTESSLALRGGKLDLGNTAYRKGQEFNVTVRLKVTEVAFVDSHDSQTGQVVATRRAHVARVVAVKA